MENELNHDYKNNGHKFHVIKFSFTAFVLTDRRGFSGKQPKLASGKSSSCWFSSSAERNANIKATEYVTFSFSFSTLVSFSFLKVWTSVCQRYGFFSILAAVIQISSDKQLVWRIVKALPFIHWPDQVVPKASDVSTADWLY